MADLVHVLRDQTLDELSTRVEKLQQVPELTTVVSQYLDGNYAGILAGESAQALLRRLVALLELETQTPTDLLSELDIAQVFLVGLSALNAFLQANVTGPPLDTSRSILFPEDTATDTVLAVRKQCLKSLEVDGISVYQYIPYIELFSLARMVFDDFFPYVAGGISYDSKWMRIRLNFYHQRQLSGGMLGVSDAAATLQSRIDGDLVALEDELFSPTSRYSTESKVQFLLEKAQIYILQGADLKARDNVDKAASTSEFAYVLSGALGKRTKFQQNDNSQLVVFAKSRDTSDGDATHAETDAPKALELNDDTLLEDIAFTKQPEHSQLPPRLAGIDPNHQPQLTSLDQIILLAEATLRDKMAPQDSLNSEEILPFAARVLSDKPTNWQTYTQALLVRSRIESHRSRTMERSVLQLQALVDQIVAETENPQASASLAEAIPEIKVTTFLPKAKPSESAPITERLRYLFQLNTPTRWELETELAYAWSNAGSLISALEIFKRLQLWAETALCYHSVGQEDKARQIIRRQLFFSSKGADMDKYGPDAAEIAAERWDGDVRPTPPHAPRYWCILGDLDQKPEHWERAWDISNRRFARAQRTLGEFYSKSGDFEKARNAYMKAATVNRHNSDTWSRLGDIDLRSGNWDGAVIAFQQAIRLDDDDAKTYNNLGSALLSKYTELKHLERIGQAESTHALDKSTAEDVLRQSLTAFKKGASMAHTNWKIWENVITIAGRLKPPSYNDILLGLRSIIRIRAASLKEDAVDVDVLRVLVSEVTQRERPKNVAEDGAVYLPQRGSLARSVIDMVDQDVVPLITHRYELWYLTEKLALYRQDYEGALASAEKAWRVASAGEEWLQKKESWQAVAEATEGLVSALENYGTQEKRDGELVEKSWKMKARSATRSILGKAKISWEGTDEYDMLQGRLAELKV